MSQLFEWDGVTPNGGRSRTGARRKICRVQGCDSTAPTGRHWYCPEHQCAVDGCDGLGKYDGHRCRKHKICAAPGCDQPARPVQAAKYCEEHATSINYVIQERNAAPRRANCMVCGADIINRNNHTAITCHTHRHLGKLAASWKRYNLTYEQIGELIRNPECWICGRDLSWRFRAGFGRRSGETKRGDRNVHVDHDHRCCPGESSCGRCVRGLACAACNRRIGYLEALLADVGTDRVRLIIDKIDRFFE